MNRLLFIFITISILGLSSCNKQKVRIACVGDSITEGAKHKWPSTSAYPVVLNNLLGDNYTVLNSGRSGTTAQLNGNSPYWRQKEISNTFAFEPDIITIKLGSNDSKTKNWDEDNFAKDIQALIDTFRTITPEPRIILCLPAPAFKNKFDIRDSIIVNGITPRIIDIAKSNNLQVIDLYTPLLDYPQCFKDGVHPNEEGAAIIAKIMAEEIANF